MMKSRHVFFAAAAALLAFAACKQVEEISVPDIQVSPATLSFGPEVSSQTVTVTATRDWTVSGAPEWMAFDPEKGTASSDAQTVNITVMANAGYNRSADVTFTIGLMKAYVHVDQAGQKGVKDNGKGTAESPFTVEGVKAYIDGLENPSAESPEQVYVKGTVSKITEAYTTQYGNGTFYIADEDGAEFYVYRALYLGNKKFSSKDKQIEVGDEVVICGNVYLFGSSSPVYETVTNKAYLYSLNGETGTNSAPVGDPKGSGTVDDPYNVAAALTAVKDLTWTSKDVYDKVGPYYVKGKISSISEEYSTQYGNGTFSISDDGTTDNEFIVYRALYLNNKKFASGDTQIKVGDEVVIYGELMNYRSDTPETVQGSAYLYSLNGETGGNSETPPDYSNAPAKTVAEFIAAADKETYYKLTGTVGGSINTTYGNFDLTDDTGTIYVYGTDNISDYASKLVSGAKVTLAAKYDYYEKNQKHEAVHAYILSIEGGDNPGETTDIKKVTVAEFLAAEVSTTQWYELTGKVSNIRSGNGEKYGNFDLTDDTGTVYVYGLTATKVDKNDQSFASLGIKEGDEITIITLRAAYNGDPQAGGTPPAYLKGGNSNPGGETTDAKKVTVAEFLAAEVSTTQWYELTGKVSNIRSGNGEKYGNFDLTDDTGTVYVYGLTATKVDKNDQSFASLGIKEGDEITIITLRAAYNGDPQAGGTPPAYLKGGNSNPGGETGGDFSSNVTWASGSDGAYNEKATVNGTTDVAVLKLGTSSKIGTSTLTLPAGSTSLTFYAISWKGKPSKLVFTVNDKEFTVEPAANDGLANNSPYTLTVADSDKYTITFDAATSVKVETSGSNTRAALFGIQAK